MKAKLIRIGNSKGIRLPKSVVEQCNLEEDIDLEVKGNVVLIRNRKKPRLGWKEAFQKMAQRKEDQLIDSDQISYSQSSWDDKEWTW